MALLLTVAAPPAVSDDLRNDGGGWLMFFGQGVLPTGEPKLERLRWWFDLQPRFTDDSGYTQLLVRPGVGWALTDELSAWLGYAFVHTDLDGREATRENRIWQQFLASLSFGPVAFQSRTRLEQRFLSSGSDVGWRFRQFFKVKVPFPFFPSTGVSAYEEAFFDLNNTDWGARSGFRQNRFFAGLFWQIDDAGRWSSEVGYLNQFLNLKNGPDRMNHICSVNLLLSWK